MVTRKSLVVLFVCVVGVSLAEKEHAHGHGKHHDPIDEDHYGDQGEHNTDYDHEAVLGNRETEDEFDNLEPEEAKSRLGKLVDKIDKDQDGYVSKEELVMWILNSFRSLDEEEAAKQHKEHDTNNDGKVSWEEYIKHIYDYSLEEATKLDTDTSEDAKQIKKSLIFDEKKYKAADTNKDGLLDALEYAAFNHPYDYDHMTDVEVESTLQEQDKDGDGKVSLQEFSGTEDMNEEQKIAEQERFKEYDKDNNGFLDNKEIRKWVAPDNMETATMEAEHLMGETDTNKDAKLSKEEIVEQHELWVGSQATDYGEHLKKKDEL